MRQCFEKRSPAFQDSLCDVGILSSGSAAVNATKSDTEYQNIMSFRRDGASLHHTLVVELNQWRWNMHPSDPSFSISQISYNYCLHFDSCNIPKYHEPPSDASTLMSKQTSIFGTPPLHNQLETGVFVACCTNLHQKNELSWLQQQHVGMSSQTYLSI